LVEPSETDVIEKYIVFDDDGGGMVAEDCGDCLSDVFSQSQVCISFANDALIAKRPADIGYEGGDGAVIVVGSRGPVLKDVYHSTGSLA
jgi:hypothetical protein